MSYPIEDFGVPASVESAKGLAKSLHDLLASGKRCWLSLQRLYWACAVDCFMRTDARGKTAAEAFDLVSLARGYPIPEGRAQAEWGRNFEREISSQ